MGFIGDVFSGSKGAGFEAQSASIMNPVTQAQADQSYKQTQDAIAQQNAFVQALNAQGGIQNQSNVFNQQQALANQLQAQASGAAPSIAQAQLANATGANVANQAALMAGQRGAGANAGLIARQAAMQGGNIQQQAAGQGAVLGLQEQMAARQALMQQQSAMAGLSSQQVGQQAQGIQGLNAAAQGQQGQILGAIQGVNSASVQNAGQMNSANAAIAAQNAKSQAGFLGALGGGVSKAVGLPFSEGGPVPGKAPVAGDSPKNDNVPAVLSPGEVVIPRSIMNSSEPGEAAKAFVEALMQKGHIKKKNFATGGVINGDGVEPAPAAPQQPTIVINTGTPQPAPVQSAPPMQVPDSVPPPANPQAAAQNQAYLASQPEAAIPTPEVNPVMAQGEANRMLAGMAPEAPGAEQGIAPKLAPQDLYGMAATEKALTSGLGQQMAGIQEEAKALGDLGKQKAQAIEATQQKLQDAQASYQENLKQLNAEQAQLQKDFASGKVDPDRYFKQMSGGQKVRTVVGLILGGFGGVANGGINPAVQEFDKMVDADIRAQEKDIEKGKNLLALNQQKFGNLKDAQEMLRVQYREGLAFEIDKAAALSQDPLEKARAKKASGELLAQNSQALGQIAARKAFMSGVQNGQMDIARAINAVVPEKDRPKAREELEMVNGFKNAVREVNDKFAEAAKIGGVGGNIPFTQAKARMGAIRAEIENALRSNMKGQGAISDKDMGSITPLLPVATDTEAQLQEKLKGIQNILNNKVQGGTPILSGVGIPIDTQTPKLTTQQERILNWAKQNPKRPESAEIMKRLGGSRG